MEFTPEISTFQGLLVSEDNVHSFSRLVAKGGYEDKIKYIIASVYKFFQDHNFIRPNGLITDQADPQIRKFALYLILNANFTVLEEMIDIEGINSVIWTVPTIPKCLLCELIWSLQMEKYLYEAIVFIQPQLGLELVEAFLNHFKYFNPTETVAKLRNFTKACYLQICHLHAFHIENNDLINKLTSALTNLQKSLKLYIEPPNFHKLNLLCKDDLYKYKGKCFQEFLLCAFACFEQYTSTFNYKPNESLEIYFLTYKDNSSVDVDALNFKMCDTNCKEILECLNHCNEALLDTCRNLVMDVSVDIFCAWSEFDDNEKSVQQVIGELCYNLLNKVSEIPTLAEHPVLSMLPQIARKPTDIRDLINVTNCSVIIEHINNNTENVETWLEALLERGNLCQDAELIKFIESKLNMFDSEMSYKLYKIIESHLKDNTDNQNDLKVFFIKVFQQCSISDKYKILDETFADNLFTDVNETTEFYNMMTEVFNKLVISPEAVVDVLTVFLQNPCAVYNKICSVAIENIQQADIMLNVCSLLKNYCNHFYSNEIEPCIIKCARNMLENNLDKETKQNNAVKFISGLKREISGNKLLMLIIMPIMHKALIDGNILNIHLQVRLLKEAYSIDELTEYRAPMLAMLAQVLNVVRWRINTFTPASPPALEDTVQLQTLIIQTYGDNVPEKENVWLKNKMINLQPLNMYYYRRLWKPPGKNFLEIISGKAINIETNTNEITSLLSQVICSISQEEWCSVWDSLGHLQSTVVLKILHDALSIQTLAEAPNRTENTCMCIHYCYRCFFYVTRYKFFKEPLSARHVTYFANKLSATAKLIKEADAEDVGNVLLPLLAYLSERHQDHKIDLATYLGASLKHTPLSFVVKLIFPHLNRTEEA